MKIYLASSWRNEHQPAMVVALRAAGHIVYDFRAPEEGNRGFSWREIHPDWQRWSADQFREALNHPVAQTGCALDTAALMSADVTILRLPCGRSAHLELGVAVGMRQFTAVVGIAGEEPELMYRMCSKLFKAEEEAALLAWLEGLDCRCGLPGHAPLRLHRADCAQLRKLTRGLGDVSPL